MRSLDDSELLTVVGGLHGVGGGLGVPVMPRNHLAERKNDEAVTLAIINFTKGLHDGAKAHKETMAGTMMAMMMDIMKKQKEKG